MKTGVLDPLMSMRDKIKGTAKEFISGVDSADLFIRSKDMPGVTFNDTRLLELQTILIEAATRLSTVAPGAYVDGAFMTKSSGAATSAYENLVEKLAVASYWMHEDLLRLVQYFGEVVEGFGQWDLDQAVAAAKLNAYNMNNGETPDPPGSIPTANLPNDGPQTGHQRWSFSPQSNPHHEGKTMSDRPRS